MGKHTARDERQRLVREWRASGMSQRAFVDARGLVLGSFRRWVSEEPADEGCGSVPPRFVEVRASEVSAAGAVVARLELGGGLALELVDWPAPEYLARLCEALVSC